MTATERTNLDENFHNVTKWLLFGNIGFDFICESLLPDLCPEASAPLAVGEMKYDVILVPGCETLRSTTLDRLEAFVNAGGKLVFAGNVPTLEDAVLSERGLSLAKKAQQVPFQKGKILQALESARDVEIRNQAGTLTDNILHQLR
jgi:hypothetical protein